MKDHAEWKRLFLTAAGVVALTAPIILGELTAPRLRAQAPTVQSPAVAQWQIDAGGKMAFDVASVKSNKSNDPSNSNVPLGPGDTYSPSGGLFSAKHTTLLNYIMFAYKIPSLNDLHGIPDWVMTDHFDIEARAQGNPSKDQMRLMIQSLLVDRFKLAIHTENQTKPIYALVLLKPGKTGPQLQPFADDGSCPTTMSFSAPPAPPSALTSKSGLQLPSMPCGDFRVLPASAPGRFRVGGKNVAMTLIARQLPSGALAGVDRPVFDRTGLSGTFNFSIEWTPKFSGPAPTPPEFTTDDPGPIFTEALQEQLGLKLESTTGPVDVLVIDHVERPSAN
jgi:uncharacterized protein (TIGR03435 family)